MMQVESRASPSIEDLRLELRSDTRSDALALEIVAGESTGSTEERIIEVLRDEVRGLRVAELRSRTRMRMQTFG